MVLARLRKDAGYSQERLAEALDVNRSYVSMVETGASKPSWRFLAAFADALRVPVQELLQSAGLVPDTTALENDIAAMIAAYPRLAEAFALARTDRKVLAELDNFARLVIAAKRQDDREQGGDTPASSSA